MTSHRTASASPPATSCLTPAAAARDGNDPIFTLHAEAVRRARAGEPVLNATLGALLRDDGRLAVMPSVGEAFARVAPERAAAYAPIAGDPVFLEAVVRDVLGDGPCAGQTVAVATPGGTGAIHNALVSFLEPGQAALIPEYFWSSYRAISSHAGRALAEFRMFGPDGRFDLEAFEAGLDALLDRQGRALVLFNFPCNNPTGYSLDADEWSRTAEVVRRAGERAPVALLVDHAYARFGPAEGERWVDAVPRMLETATVLVAWTVSKSFAQYGARVGALLALHADPDERERMRHALTYGCRATWSNCNHLGLLATAELLTDAELARRADEERAELIGLLGERVDAFVGEATDAGLDFPRYEGGFFVSVFTPDAGRTAARMREDGVFVLPMRDAVRVALCATPAAEVPRLVRSLEAGLAEAAR